MIDLSPNQAASRIKTLLGASETRTLDFKRISAKDGRMIEAVCAFANSEGGLLAIGVEDAKQMKPGAKPESRLFGIEENVEAFDDFRRQVMARFLLSSSACTGCACHARCATAVRAMWCCCGWRRATRCIP